MKSFLPYLIVCITVILSACGVRKDDSFEVSATIANMPNGVAVFLEEIGLNNELRIVDSARSITGGTFALKSRRSEFPKMYRVKMGTKWILLLDDTEKVTVSADWKDLEQNYTVSGSPGSTSLNKLWKHIYDIEEKVTGLHMAIDQAHIKGGDSVLSLLQSDLKQANADGLSFLKAYADTTKYLPVAILAILNAQNFDSSSLMVDQQYLKSFMKYIDEKFGNQPLAANFKSILKNVTGNEIGTGTKIQVGQEAPNFVLNTPDTEPVNLNQYKGKYILVDFWASWCPPCRKENPNLVAVYKEFKHKNFDILGVSLDTNLVRWQDAIKTDSLAWTHVSDLGGWNSSVVDLYGLKSIPANYLLDPEGKVIATGLNGVLLRSKLEEIFP